MTEYYTKMKVQSGGVAVHSRNVDAAYIGGEASTKSNDLPSAEAADFLDRGPLLKGCLTFLTATTRGSTNF